MRVIPLLTAMMLATFFVVTPLSAGETTTYEYTAGPSVWVGESGLGIYPCPSGCDLDGDGQNDYPFSHGPFPVPYGYTNVIVSASDDVHGPDVALYACFHEPGGPAACTDDFGSAPTCGLVASQGSSFSGTLHVYVIAVLIDADFNVCGATTGMLTIASG